MCVAVLADIHGNLPALEAVLREVEAAEVDAVVLGGDLADGPMPAQTLDRLEELGEQAIWVRGNTDRWLAEAFDGTFQHSGLATNYQAAFADVPTQTVVIGHTHMPFDRLADTRRIINPGSVGLPYGHPGAAWALLGPEVVLRRTAYDTDTATATLSATASDMPGIEFITGNIQASASDAEALAAFNEAIEHQAGQR
jgi:predicted phosphodiesterase